MTSKHFLCSILLAGCFVTPGRIVCADTASSATVAVAVSTAAEPSVHAIHLTASAAGSKKYRKNHLEKMFAETQVNAVIIDIKEEDGYVYVPGVTAAERTKAYARDIPDLEQWLKELKQRHIYTIARIVCFKDNITPRKNPSLGVHNPTGELWHDHKHITWLDPYNHEAWKYIFLIGLRCAQIGFDEIQFDYIRYPTDGSLSQMRFKRPYTKEAASKNLVEFLHEAAQVIHPLGAKISIDVFGLVTSVSTGMGIGQVMNPMAAEVDYVCPMTYPSHYARGEYGIPNPNDNPYRTIHLAMHDALKTLGPQGVHKLRPYFQDFSLPGRGIRYGPKEVRAQLQAAADLGVMNWSLWNARCSYTLSALKDPLIPAANNAHVAVSSSTHP